MYSSSDCKFEKIKTCHDVLGCFPQSTMRKRDRAIIIQQVTCFEKYEGYKYFEIDLFQFRHTSGTGLPLSHVATLM